MIEVSQVLDVVLDWEVVSNDRLLVTPSLPDLPNAWLLRMQIPTLNGGFRIPVPLHHGYRLPGRHVYQAYQRRLQRQHRRGVYYRLRCDAVAPDQQPLAPNTEILVLENPLAIQPVQGSGRDRPVTFHAFRIAGTMTRGMTAPSYIQQWHPRFGRPTMAMDYAAVRALAPRCPIDIGRLEGFTRAHDPLLRDLQADPSDHVIDNCITDGLHSLPLTCPPAARWMQTPLLPFAALRRVGPSLWPGMITFLTGKLLADCIDLLESEPEEDGGGGGGTAASEEETDLGAGTPLPPGPCYSGPFRSLRFVGSRFMFEIRRRRLIDAVPVTTVVWLLDFPVYGRALRIYEQRADAEAYAHGRRTGIAAPLLWRAHSGNWQADTEAFLAQFGQPE